MGVVIIGGGSAGTTCAFELRKLDKDVEVTLIEATGHTEYSPCALPYVLSGEMRSFDDVFIFREAEYAANHIDFRPGSVVTGVDRDAKTITYNAGSEEKQVGYDKLVLATGSSCRIPPIEGVESCDHAVLKTIDDAKDIAEGMAPGRRSVVVGAGFVGVELADALARKGEDVTLVEAQDRVLPAMLDRKASSLVKRHLESVGVTVVEDEAIKKFDSGDVVLSERRLPSDKVFFCTGVEPNMDLAKVTGLEVDRGIVVDEFLRTSVKDVFACGDGVESVEFASGERTLSQLGTTAVRQAQTVARNILGGEERFPPVLNTTVTCVGGLFVGAVGLTSVRAGALGLRPVSASFTCGVRAEYYPSESRITVTVVCDGDGVVVGGQVVGDEEVVGRVDLLALAVRQRLPVGRLAGLETCYNPASAPIFDPLTVAAGICVKKLSLSRRGA